MARKRYPPTDPREWLNRAKSNLALAQAETSAALFEDLCFEAQQATEKAVKSVFIHRGASFPYIHDLDRLLYLLEQDGVKVPLYVKASKELTRFALVTRYPGFSGSITKRGYRRALRIARAVVGWAERQIGGPSSPMAAARKARARVRFADLLALRSASRRRVTLTPRKAGP